MLHLLQMGPSKVLTTFPFQNQSSWQLSLLELPPHAVTLWLLPRTSPTCKPPLYNLAPPLLMLHSRPTLVSKPLIPHLPILYLLPLPPHHHLLLLAFLLRHLTLPGFFNGTLEVFEPGALSYFTFFRLILSTLSASRNPNLTHLPLSGFLDSLRSDRTHSRCGILSSDSTHAGGGVVIFVRQGISFSELSTSSLSSLDPYSDYVWINISLNNFSSLSFLNMYAPLFAPPQRMAEPTLFFSSILPFTKNLFILGDFNCHHPLWDSRVTSDPCGDEVFDWVISNLRLLNNPDTPTLLHRSFPDISFAPPSLAPGRCFRTWVLITYQFFYLSLSLRPIVPTSAPLPSIFRKLAGMTLPPALTVTVHLQRNTRLFPLLLLSLPLWH